MPPRFVWLSLRLRLSHGSWILSSVPHSLGHCYVQPATNQARRKLNETKVLLFGGKYSRSLERKIVVFSPGFPTRHLLKINSGEAYRAGTRRVGKPGLCDGCGLAGGFWGSAKKSILTNIFPPFLQTRPFLPFQFSPAKLADFPLLRAPVVFAARGEARCDFRRALPCLRRVGRALRAGSGFRARERVVNVAPAVRGCELRQARDLPIELSNCRQGKSYEFQHTDQIEWVLHNSQFSERSAWFGNLHSSIRLGFTTARMVELATTFNFKLPFGQTPTGAMFHKFTAGWR
jgi:hypothetical protein